MRGKCDQNLLKTMLNITDAGCQQALPAEAKKNNTIAQDDESQGRRSRSG